MRSCGWAFLAVFLVASAGMAWGQSAQSWGAWGRSSQQGVQVRAFCSSDVPLRANPSVVMSLWKYQLRNTTAAAESVRWRVEHFDGTTGANRMGAPSLAVVRPGKTSAVYQTSLVGSCAALPSIHVAVLVPSKGGAGGTSHASTAKDVASAAFAYRGAVVPPASSKPLTQNQSPSAVIEAVANSSWKCQLVEDASHMFDISFDPNGRYFITRDDGRDTFPGASQINGNQITWADEFGRLYSLQVHGNSIYGKTSTFDLVESRGREYHGRIACSRAADRAQ